MKPYICALKVKNKPRQKHHASCQTCDVRACVMRWRLTLARTLSLCWVRAMALVGPAAWGCDLLVAERAVEGTLYVSLTSSADLPERATVTQRHQIKQKLLEHSTQKCVRLNVCVIYS